MNGLVIAGVFLVFFQTSSAGWTTWLNRDDPFHDGDFELRTLWSSKFLRPCSKGFPTRVEARIRGYPESVMSSTKYIEVGPHYGLVCAKDKQHNSGCLDYEVQYTIPLSSQWYNKDFPSDDGDFELKKKLKDTDGWRAGRVVSWRTKPFDARNEGSTDRRIIMGPRYGFTCDNEANIARCHDYEVRFYC